MSILIGMANVLIACFDFKNYNKGHRIFDDYIGHVEVLPCMKSQSSQLNSKSSISIRKSTHITISGKSSHNLGLSKLTIDTSVLGCTPMATIKAECPRCKVPMKLGSAIESHEERGCFHNGPPIHNHETIQLVTVLKCPECGHSEDFEITHE